MRWESPPSVLRLAAEAKAFSISSIHRMIGGHHLGLLEGFSQSAFGFAYVAVVQRADIHA